MNEVPTVILAFVLMWGALIAIGALLWAVLPPVVIFGLCMAAFFATIPALKGK